MANISINKYEYNLRKIDEINEKIIKLEKELNEVKGFNKTLTLKTELRELYKQLNIHGSEALEFEIHNSQ